MRWWPILKSIFANFLFTTWVEVIRWVLERLVFLIATLEPFTYLGLPIKVTSLSRKDWQPLTERVEKKLAIWKGNALSRGGRLILVNSNLSSLPLYFLFFYYFPEWVIHVIDRIRHSFFWKGIKDIHGGVCLINWQLVCSHKNQGGLGVYVTLALTNHLFLNTWML